MTLIDAFRHLHERAITQRQKTNRNRNRWTLRDVEAVETLLGEISKASVERARKEQA